jgi:peptidoglycan/xylan/chitin deacetylase (PgdA/CDA1 family)
MKIRGIARGRQVARRITSVFQRKTIVLLYHRVATLVSDPQLLSVTPQHFAEHLDVLRKYYRPVSLKDSERRVQRAVVITFDDGYADNLWNAKPLLERYEVPATVFITTGYIGRQREFWWDELERLLLDGERLPKTVCLKINGGIRRWELGTGDMSHHTDQTWNLLAKSDPSPRQSLYRSLHQLLRPMREIEQRQVLDDLVQFTGTGHTPRPSYRALTPDEVIRLAEGRLVEVGAHSVTHPVLATLAVDAQYAEVQESKADLEKILGRPIPSFAYPYGSISDYTQATVAAVRQAGYVRACANFPGPVEPKSDRFQLPRFLVRDCDGDRFARQLREWFQS